MELGLVRVERGAYRVVNVDDVYYVEADGGDTLVHRRGTRPLRDTRPLGAFLEGWASSPLVRVHDGYAVHPIHVYEIRLRDSRRDWELRLEPPLNAVLPVSRTRLGDMWEAFGEAESE